MLTLPENRIVQWDDPNVDLDWIRSRHNKSVHNLVAMTVQSHEWVRLKGFSDFISTLFDEPLEFMQFYTACISTDIVNKSDPEWSFGFPHTHNNELVTIAIVLQVPESGGEAVLEGTVIEPKVGQGMIVRGDEEHGVKRVYGDVPRIGVMTQFRSFRP